MATFPDDLNYRLFMIQQSFSYADQYGQSLNRMTLARSVYALGAGQPAPENIDDALAEQFVEDMLQLRNSTSLDVLENWKRGEHLIASRLGLSFDTDLFKAFDSQRQHVQAAVDVNPSEAIAQILRLLEARIELFLKKENPLPLWRPPPAWSREQVPGTGLDLRSHLLQLGLPMNPLQASPSSTPDFLLYMLGLYEAVDAGRLKRRAARLLSGESHRVVMNTSGSGKSRLLFETLCLEWGLYLTCACDMATNPYGSEDITVCLEESFLKSLNVDGCTFNPDAWPISSSSKARCRQQLEANQLVVEHVMRSVVLARFLVLQVYLRVAASLNVTNEQQLRGWLLLQLFPRLTETGELKAGVNDFFEELTMICVSLPPRTLTERLRSVQNSIPADKYPRLVVFDEVQTVSAKWRSAFADERYTSTRSLLRPIVIGTQKGLRSARFMIAGTRLFYNDVLNALSSNIFKQHSFTEFTDLGGYFRWEADMRRFLYHIFTPALVNSWPSDISENIRFWMSGRHRFLVVCVQHILMQGPHTDSVRNVIDNIVFVATREHLPQYAALYKPIERVQIKGLVPSAFMAKTTRARERSSIRQARKGVLQFLTQMTFPKYGLKQIELVDLGIGRFVTRDDNRHIEISERLVLSALRVFFDSPTLSSGSSIRSVINDALSDPSGSEAGTGLAFEDAMIYLFWLRFSGDGALLSDVFEFEADLRPAWANRKGRLIAAFHPGSRAAKDFALRGLVSVLARNVGTIEESLAWFKDTIGVPFLKPDNFFGPDIIFALQLYDADGRAYAAEQTLFVCVQCKNWSQQRQGFAVRHAIFTASPEGFYKSYTARQEELYGYLAPFTPLPGTLLNKTDVQTTVSASAKPRTSARDAKEEAKIKYAEKVEFAVLRCLATFPDTAVIDRPVSTHNGIYPLATISHEIMRLGCSVGFDRFKHALEQANIAFPAMSEEELLEMRNDEFDIEIAPYDPEEELHNNFKLAWEQAMSDSESELPAGEEQEASALTNKSSAEQRRTKEKGQGKGKGKAMAKTKAVTSAIDEDWEETEDDEPLPLPPPAPATKETRPRTKAKRPAKRPRPTSSEVSLNTRPKRRQKL